MGALIVPVSARADSSAVWLPTPREEIESAERLDEPPEPPSSRGFVLARVARPAEAGWRPKRLAATWERVGPPGAHRGVRSLSVSLLEADGDPAPTVALTAGGVRVAAGRLTADRAPWLLSRRLGLARPIARVPEARAAIVRAVAPLAASTPAAAGIAGERAGGRLRPWLLAGRGGDGEDPIAAVGATVRGRREEIALAIGREAARGLLSLAVATRAGPGRSSVELLLAEGRSGLLASVSTRRGGVELWCRLRYQAGEARPGAGEGGAVALGRLGSARLTWRAWTPAARADNGALELEASTALGPGHPIRARVGERPGTAGGATAFPAAPPEAPPAERYALLEATLAGTGSRSLSLLASARGSGRSGRSGRTLGARLRVGEGGASRLTLLVQAARSGAGAPAIGSELTASGQSLLAEETRSGIVAAARGIARCGPVELGGVWEREEGAGGARPRSVSFWMRWFP